MLLSSITTQRYEKTNFHRRLEKPNISHDLDFKSPNQILGVMVIKNVTQYKHWEDYANGKKCMYVDNKFFSFFVDSI